MMQRNMKSRFLKADGREAVQMSKSTYDELDIRVPDWSDVVRIEREARAYRSAYIAAAAARVWRRLMDRPERSAEASLKHRHA